MPYIVIKTKTKSRLKTKNLARSISSRNRYRFLNKKSINFKIKSQYLSGKSLGADFFVCVNLIYLYNLLLKYKYLRILVYIFLVFLSNILLDEYIEFALLGMSLDSAVDKSSIAANADDVALL